MRTIQKRNSRMGRLILPVLTLAVLAYFGLQSQQGRYGLESKRELTELLDKRSAELDALLDKRQGLETRVQMMRDGTLERDMLDERARRALNVGTVDEIVILR
ncbi:septum formation initiator family protein [Aureimonas fodinaquatilis]|uniref:Septum formation initiator family protein n=1 Tax=Aureimonas fodinaquatilis TaxID=2565783 RepID=A0A5B0DVM7_9HYPH|nr:septum formation initiator family protein [Aureimonas fodinaquatilis]KAA0970473.1 septum formation initiator family protein [Aureimonas fodinaquatilis]